MKKVLFLVTICSLTLVACDRPENKPKNTLLSEQDSATKMPLDQSESEMDRTITKRIRQTIMSDDTLSINAKNIKITTINGMVTLRGMVTTAKEKEDIASKAKDVPGVQGVENQLEITRNTSY
jgi:hyperosmotically inducible protein